MRQIEGLIDSLHDLNDEMECFSNSIEYTGYSLHYIVNSFAMCSEEELREKFQEDYDEAEEIYREMRKVDERYTGTMLKVYKLFKKYNNLAENLNVILNNYNNLEAEKLKESVQDLEKLTGGDT